MSEHKKSSEFLRGLKEGLPVGISYFPIAIAISITITQSGINFWFNQLLCATTYSGTAQLTFNNLFHTGETAILMYLIALFVANFRYVIFGIALSQRMHPETKTWQRALYGAFNTDEIYVLAVRNEGYLEFPYLFGLMIVPFLGFVSGGVLGALFTNLLPLSLKPALEILIYGMFIAMIVPEAKKSRPVFYVVLIAAGISYLLECIPAVKNQLTGGQIMIICALASSAIGALLFPIKVNQKEEA